MTNGEAVRAVGGNFVAGTVNPEVGESAGLFVLASRLTCYGPRGKRLRLDARGELRLKGIDLPYPMGQRKYVRSIESKRERTYDSLDTHVVADIISIAVVHERTDTRVNDRLEVRPLVLEENASAVTEPVESGP